MKLAPFESCAYSWDQSLVREWDTVIGQVSVTCLFDRSIKQITVIFHLHEVVGELSYKDVE